MNKQKAVKAIREAIKALSPNAAIHNVYWDTWN